MNDHANDDTAGNLEGENAEPGTRRDYRERTVEQNGFVAETDAGVGNAAPADPAMQEGAEADAGVMDAAPTAAATHELTATTDHDVIRRWAEDRHAVPATVGTEQEGGIGELRFDLDFGDEMEELREVSWDDWFRAFDERGLQFVFQEGLREDGSASNEFHLEQSRGTRV
ncbi:hypothetical protein [Microbacterium sp. E-13]|uniref:hypothetical protein n=1 Tax=Microbacterium sp. E-13 TaxID=3404048 RepID=UPI003CE7AB2A